MYVRVRVGMSLLGNCFENDLFAIHSNVLADIGSFFAIQYMDAGKLSEPLIELDDLSRRVGNLVTTQVVWGRMICSGIIGEPATADLRAVKMLCPFLRKVDT